MPDSEVNVQGWTDELATGDEPIDAEHRLLFDHIARILTTAGRRGAREALEEFQRHVVEHFEREVALMRSTEYPGLEPHLRAHDVLAKYVKELERTMASRDAGPADIDTAVRLIANALAAHTQGQDRALARYLDARRRVTA